ncbi:MAG: hypothetical protein CL515_01935 [Actinobacteria bacterium]|nr:hypothetical protein [Actinomycetota bacterium]|tara:strand:- start:1089 stop:1586 length:498 start_codon:yes stop_codon:yes gene_type:complete
MKIQSETEIAIYTLDNHQELNNKLKKIISDFRKEYPESDNSNVKAWHSHFDTHIKEPKFNILIDRVMDASKDFINIKCNLYLLNFWVMEYKKGNHAVKHNHWPATLSGVYYIDVEENSSPIIFENNFVIKPKNGMLLLFPSIVNHEVPPSKGKRIVASFNLQFIP